MPWADDGVRWFGVKVWKTWRVQGSLLEHVEESIHAVRASSEEDAREKALASARRDDSHFRNEDDEEVTIALSHIDHIFDTHETRMTSGTEIFSRVYELDDEGVIDGGWPQE